MSIKGRTQDNMEDRKNKKNIISLIVLCVSIVALTTSLTYAYFVSQVGTNEQEKITIKSGDLALTFRDNDETVENIEDTWNFGDSIEKELVIENTGTKDAYAKISWDNLINTYLAESLAYTLEEKSDESGAVWKPVETVSANVPRSESATTQLLVDHLLIPAGHTYSYRVRITFEDLEDTDQTVDLNAKFITKFILDQGTKKITLEDKLINMNIKINPNNPISFANPATTNETANGLFSMQDDYGTSYYYRGTAPNNYIKFGQNANGQDMWWRIIRFNGDGTIRMQYDGSGTSGTNSYTRGFVLSYQLWNSNEDDAKYVGWMFGGANGSVSTSKEQAQRNETDSTIKTEVDKWYKKNIVDTGYGNYVADSIFCNDRSTPGKSATGLTDDIGLGYGKNITGYGAYARLGGHRDGPNYQNPKPDLICPQENDKFTVEAESTGNGYLTYPVGLITADEIVIAGSGMYNTVNRNYYLNKGETYWSFSSSDISGVYGSMFVVDDEGKLSLDSVSNGTLRFVNCVAPVINLKAEYLNQLEGTGKANDPFRIG